MAAHAVPEDGGQLAHELLHVAGAGAHLHRAGVELGEVEDVVDELEERGGAEEDAVGVLLAAALVGVFAGEELREPDDGVERRPELVRHHGEEARLRLGVLLRLRRGLLGARGLPLQQADHHEAVDGDPGQHRQHHPQDHLHQLLAGETEHAVHDLALGLGAHEHLLEAHGVDAGHRLVEDRHQLGRSPRTCEHLELKVWILGPVELAHRLRHGQREHRRGAVRGLTGLDGVRDPQAGLAAQEPRLRGLQARLLLRHDDKAGLALDLDLQEFGEAGGLPLGVENLERPRREVHHHRRRILPALRKPFRLLEREGGHLVVRAVVALADHAHVLGEVVAHLLQRPLQLVEEVRPVRGGADVHRVRGVEVQRHLVREVGHLHVDAGVDLVLEVRLHHLAVGRVLAVLDAEVLVVELALGALRADGAGEHAHAHALPSGQLADLVLAFLRMRPEVHAQHPDGRVREEEVVAARGVETEAADQVQPPAFHVGDAFVVSAVHEVGRPPRGAAERLHPHLERAGLLAVRRHVEEVAAHVRGHAHALRGLRDAQQLRAQRVDPVDVVDVVLAVGLGQLLQQVGAALPHGEVHVARADRHDLDESLRTLPEGGVQEQRVDVAVAQRLHRARARGVLHVLRRELRAVEVPLPVAAVALRDGGVAHAHARPFGYFRGHHGHRPFGRRVERVVHPAQRLQREGVVLLQRRRTEGGADHVDVSLHEQAVRAERDALRLQTGRFEHVGHHGLAELGVRRRPDVQVGAAHAVRHLYGLRHGGESRQKNKCARLNLHTVFRLRPVCTSCPCGVMPASEMVSCTMPTRCATANSSLPIRFLMIHP